MAEMDQPLQMPEGEVSAPTPVALGLARAKLKSPLTRQSMWPLLGAAGLAAGAALCLAAVVILGPPSIVSRQVDVNPWVR